jgi:hypothetical protein
VVSVAGMRIDVTATAHAAAEMLDAADGLADATRPPLSILDDFGDASPSRALTAAHHRCLTEALAALDVIGEVLEDDADRLYQVAFATEEVEGATVRRMHGAGHRLLWQKFVLP